MIGGDTRTMPWREASGLGGARGVQGCAHAKRSSVSESNRKTMRAQQSAALRKVASAPRYVRNSVIQRDLRIELIECFITQLARRMFARTETTTFIYLKDIAPWHARPPDRRAYPRDLT
ncbi:jg19129 [Pararge aegeria aegeria]|uniref:Jg19129 protein n=1 Tax=Pararge aegeria aegeria TaxID=348720 RepID=A0A8S4RPG1_9NEOP|nr:jg19129 [Pararge aegeria aegeria]